MIEIIILIFLTREIGRLALRKGQKPLTWKIYNVLGWLTFECIGLFVGLMIFGKNNLISVNLIGIAFAVTSYFIIKAQLNKLPDYEIDDDIHNLGNHK
jgi:hypothetical protein